MVASVTNGAGTYNFSGGNILDNGGSPTSLRINWNLGVNFDYVNTSLGFTGGTGVGTGTGGNNSGNLIYNLTSASGNYHFGTGDITFGGYGGMFQFNPDAPATLTNNIVFNGDTGSNAVIRGNANSTFSGLVTVDAGGNFNRASSSGFFGYDFVSTNATGILINDDQDIEFSFNAGGTNGSDTKFQSNVDGQGIHSVRLLGSSSNSANPDWDNQLTQGTTPWNIKNLTKTGMNATTLAVDETTFFSSIESNGGQFLIEGGMIQFRNATDTATTLNPTINFDLIIDPNPATQRSGYGDYAGLNNVDSLNVVSGGLVGGSLLAERSNRSSTITWQNNLVVNINGGEISPGNGGIDTLQVLGEVNFVGPGGTMRVEISDPTGIAGTDWDLLTTLGDIDFSAPVTLDIFDLGGLQSNLPFSIMIAEAGGTIANFDPNLFTINANGSGALFSVEVQNGNQLFLNAIVPPVPEPGTLQLLGMFLLSLFGRRRVVAAGRIKGKLAGQ